MPASVGPAALPNASSSSAVGLVIDPVVDQDDSGRAVAARVGGFAVVLGVIGVDLAVEYALFVVFLRFVREHEHEFAVHVDSRVVVVVVFRGGDAVSGEDDSAGSFSARRKVERHEILIGLERLPVRRRPRNRSDWPCPVSRWW